MGPCSFVKFQAVIAILEHLKCDDLARASCQLLPKCDVFDHFFKVKVAEICWGTPTPLLPNYRISAATGLVLL